MTNDPDIVASATDILSRHLGHGQLCKVEVFLAEIGYQEGKWPIKRFAKVLRKLEYLLPEQEEIQIKGNVTLDFAEEWNKLRKRNSERRSKENEDEGRTGSGLDKNEC